jgi:hypothetical protein
MMLQLGKGIQAFFRTPKAPSAPPDGSAVISFDTPSPSATSVAMQLKAAAPVITQKKTVTGIMGKANRAKRQNNADPGKKLKLPPKSMDAAKGVYINYVMSFYISLCRGCY